MMDREQTIKRHEELKQLRALEEGEWRDIADVLRPDQDMRPDEKRRSRYSEIFDSTPLYALDDFVGGLFGQATNPANRWFELGLEDQDLARWQPVKLWLHQASSIALASASPAVSTFYEDIPASFADLGAFGHGVMFSEEDVGQRRFIDRAIPIGQVFFDEDLNGNINIVHREWRARGRQLERKFGKIDGVREDQEYTIIHSVHENAQADPRRIGPDFMPFRSLYCSPDLKGWDRAKGYWEMPYQIPRWARRGMTPYCSGPGHMARPDMRMLNEMERSHIVAGQFAAEPPWMVHDESVLTVADFSPNSVLYGAMTDQGKQLVSPLARGAQLQLTMQQSEQRRKAIQQAFYFSVMQLIARPQMTAAEFLGFSEENLRRMAAHLARIQSGGLSPWVVRRFRMLERAGQLPPLPPELEGKQLTVVYNSPLAKVQAAAEARASVQWVTNLIQVAQAAPNEAAEVLDKVDFDAFADITHGGYATPPTLLRSERAIEERRKQRAMQAAQQQQLDQTGQAVTIAAEAAHASQAQTLASGRSAGR